MRGLPNDLARSISVHKTAAANTAVTDTLAASAGVTHVIDKVTAGYSEDPGAGAGKLTVAIDGTTVFEVDITADDPLDFEWDYGLYGDPAGNEAVVFTLAAGGGTAVGKLNYSYR